MKVASAGGMRSDCRRPTDLLLRSLAAPAAIAALLALTAPAAAASTPLQHRLGRNEVRVLAAPHEIRVGDVLRGSALADRLASQGYERVRRKPDAAGRFFWGHDRFWVFRREFLPPGKRLEPARLIEIELDRSTGRVRAVRFDDDRTAEPGAVALEPLVLAESLEGRHARREWIPLDRLPEHAWRSVLAIEDARFFDHGGVDPRAVARALLRNAKAGRVAQGGSTITQQLIKVRDLTPRRTVGRKISEAVRALALEAEHDKEEILEAYLNSVYFGHVGGVSLHGVGPASRAYFGKSAERLSVGEAALLAAMIQGPNRLHPKRHPKDALARQRLVLDRMEELGWLSERQAAAARRVGLPALSGLGTFATSPLQPALSPGLLAWIRADLARLAPRRAEEAQGVVVQTTLDPRLQAIATEVVEAGLASLRRRSPRLRRPGLGAALLALDGRNGAVLAAVGGDPGRPGDFDRVRRARRQPGSSVKPFVMLEALEACGEERPLYASRRISDRPLTIDLPSGAWSPRNPTGEHRGTVDLRTALVDSLNVPVVRVARWCGFDATARRFRRAGLPVPEAPPPSFVLGSVEVAPIELAAAYTAFVTPGRRQEPRLVQRALAPSGRGLGKARPKSRRVSGAAAAYLVRDLLKEAGSRTLGATNFEGLELIGKTGTSSEQRDAWFAGSVGSMVVVAWVGFDDGRSLGLSGAQAAAPIWKAFAERGASGRPGYALARPRGVVERWVDPRSGLLVRPSRKGARRELFRKGDEPGRKRILFGASAERPIG